MPLPRAACLLGQRARVRHVLVQVDQKHGSRAGSRRTAIPRTTLVSSATFLLSTVVSFPLNMKELWLEIQVSSWRELPPKSN